jgi:hypothetical protein
MVTVHRFPREMSGIVVVLAIVLSMGTLAPVHAVWKAKIRSTTQGAPWTDETSVPIVNAASTAMSVAADTTVKYQTIDGFGGCFNEIGWKVLNYLKIEGRTL